jgi:outer membrane receptor for ferrienterochelin and colicins
MRVPLLLFAVFLLIINANAQVRPSVVKHQKDTISKELQEVVVTGEFQPQSLKNTVYHTRIISVEKIRLRAATNVQQLLSTELGFRFSNDLTLGTSDIQMMGMTGRNVKILLDGVPMVDRSDTRESLNQIDINTIERIEIVEGPLSVSYGSDALAGVINIITKKPGDNALNINARVQEETVGKEYSPFSKSGLHVQHIGAGLSGTNWNVVAGLTHNEFNGYNVPFPTETAEEIAALVNRWKPKEQWQANTRLGYHKDKLNLWYKLDYLDETIDSKGGYNPNNYKATNQQYITNRVNQQLQSDFRFNEKVQLSGFVAYSNLKRRTKSLVHDYSTGTEVLSGGAGEQDVSKFNSISIRSTLQFKASKKVSFQPGIEINLDGSSGARISGSPSINDYAFFLSSEINLLKNLTVRPGLRFIKNSVYDAPPVIPSINTKLRLNDKLDFRLGYASGFRAPALRELYYDFVDASHNIVGNPNLKAEQSNSFTASLTFAGEQEQEVHFRSVLSGFYNKFKNRIDYGISATDANVNTLINISRYKTTGGTWEQTLNMKNISTSLGLSYIGTYNQYSESTDLYGSSPEFVWSPEVNTNVSYILRKLDATVNLAYKFSGKRSVYEIDATTNNARLARTGSFSLADLMVTKGILNTLTLNAGVKNLLDVTTVSNTAIASGAVHSTGAGPVAMNYGRSYVVGLSFNWTKQ